MTVLILGAGGMLGRAMTGEFPGARTLRFEDLDITHFDALRAAVEPGTSLVLNAAADTRVDLAEKSDDHLLVNEEAVGVLAARCREVGARLVHVSTDYVFDGRGTRPYLEDDPVSPVNAYGRGKLGGERRALESGADVLVVRTSWVFGTPGPNFPNAILRQAEAGKTSLRVVDDQRGRPTWSGDLARAIRLLVAREARGVVHFANAGETTWFGLARTLLDLAGFAGVELEPCRTSDYPVPAPRPAYSVLDTTRFERLTGETPRPWSEPLALYLAERGVSRPAAG